MTQNTSHAVMAQRKEPHDSLDFFPTPLWATRALCRELNGIGQNLYLYSCWEPACGNGAMARPLAEYFKTVDASDVHDYGFGLYNLDFLLPGLSVKGADWIITNPPFRLAADFALMAIERADIGVALLVRSVWLESAERYHTIFNKIPPSHVFQFSGRVAIHKDVLAEKGSTATAYSWVVWRKPLTKGPHDTILRWIPPTARKELEKPGDWK